VRDEKEAKIAKMSEGALMRLRDDSECGKREINSGGNAARMADAG
jgi:hypothetical protein